uniref:Uncharacterized protein n=1 Tax=Anopheles melas TaxID=34690 RepID=A0A182TSC7_9DIPT
MKLVLVALSTVMVISAGLSLKPSPRRDIAFPRHMPSLPDPDRDKGTDVVHSNQLPPHGAKPARLRVSDTRRSKKVKQTSSSSTSGEHENTRVTERKLHTKIVHVPEPFVVHVEKPYPVYIEKPVIVEKHLPLHLYIKKKETKHH